MAVEDYQAHFGAMKTSCPHFKNLGSSRGQRRRDCHHPKSKEHKMGFKNPDHDHVVEENYSKAYKKDYKAMEKARQGAGNWNAKEDSKILDKAISKILEKKED